MALGLIHAARNRGLSIPEDLKVTGIDDYEIGATSPVPLTTYHVPYETMGRKAFEVLNAQMAGDARSSSETQVRGTLVVRKSA